MVRKRAADAPPGSRRRKTNASRANLISDAEDGSQPEQTPAIDNPKGSPKTWSPTDMVFAKNDSRWPTEEWPHLVKKSLRIRQDEGKNSRAEWQVDDAVPELPKRPTKGQLSELKKFTGPLWGPDEHGNESFILPPKLTALSDEAVYWVTKHCSQSERAGRYPVDFDANGDIRGNRAPMGPPPIVMVNGLHCLPIWKGYIIACGELIGAIIRSHRLGEKSDRQLKHRSLHEWMVGAVVVTPALVRQARSTTLRFLHDDLGKLTDDLTPMEKASVAVRDGVCHDHHDKAMLVDHKGPQFIENWRLSNYQARFSDRQDATAIPRAFFEKHRIPLDYMANTCSAFHTNPTDLYILPDDEFNWNMYGAILGHGAIPYASSPTFPPPTAPSRQVDAGEFGKFFPEIRTMVTDINAALDAADEASALKKTLRSEEVQRALKVPAAYATARSTFLAKREAISTSLEAMQGGIKEKATEIFDAAFQAAKLTDDEDEQENIDDEKK